MDCRIKSGNDDLSSSLRGALATKQSRGRWHLSAPRLPPFQSGLLKTPLGGNALGGEIGVERVGRIEHRVQSLIEQMLLAEIRLRADRLELAIEPFDDRGRRSGRRDQAEIH